MHQYNNSFNTPEAILFDVYGTLLNMADVEREISALFDSKRGCIKWYDLTQI